MRWYLPVLVVDEKPMRRIGGIGVVVLMKRVAVGKSASGVVRASNAPGDPCFEQPYAG